MLKSGWLSILMLQHRFNVDITSIFGCDLSNLGWNSTLWFNIDTTLSQCWIHNINKGRISTLWFNIDTTLSRCCVHNIDRREISTKIQHCPAVVLRLHADAYSTTEDLDLQQNCIFVRNTSCDFRHGTVYCWRTYRIGGFALETLRIKHVMYALHVTIKRVLNCNIKKVSNKFVTMFSFLHTRFWTASVATVL